MARNKKKKRRSRHKKLLRAAGKPSYWLRYRIGEYCLRGFVRMMPWIPRRSLAIFTSFAEKVTFALLWKYRIRMEENLAVAMGEEFPSPGERRALVRRAWRNFAQGILETSWIMHVPREEILSAVAIEGEEHLKRALTGGKGVIALSAHLGNFTMIGARLAAAGYPYSAVVKQPRDWRFARLIDRYRAQVGIQTISAKPRREAVRGILRALRANGVVLLIADEFKSGGVQVNFFGRTSPAPRGPATLALRTGAATLPIYVTRDSNDRLTLHIEPQIELIEGDQLEQSVAANTALFTQHLEAMVRRYPDQWNWLGFHRDGRKPRTQREKSRPTRPGSGDPSLPS
jgi:KDO2-lipid IV(A) lauroyltransferase